MENQQSSTRAAQSPCTYLSACQVEQLRTFAVLARFSASPSCPAVSLTVIVLLRSVFCSSFTCCAILCALPRFGRQQPTRTTMTTREIVYTDKVNPPMHVFSQATKAGNIVYTSGNTGNTLDGKLKAGTCADRTVSLSAYSSTRPG